MQNKEYFQAVLSKNILEAFKEYKPEYKFYEVDNFAIYFGNEEDEWEDYMAIDEFVTELFNG